MLKPTAITDEIRRRLIFPGKMTQGTQDSRDFGEYQDFIVEIETVKLNKVCLLYGEGLSFCEQQKENLSGFSLLFFYGNGMCLSRSTYHFDYFRKMGVNVVIVEYVGYGTSTGNASEEGCYEAAEAAYKFLVHAKGFHPEKIIIAGWSLGAAVGIHIASRHTVSGLILLSAFTSISDEAAQSLPLPKWLIEMTVPERFDNLNKISQVKCPVFVSHGTKDDIVPFSMAKELRKRLEGCGCNDFTFIPIDGAKHNDFFYVGDELLWREIKKFICILAEVTLN